MIESRPPADHADTGGSRPSLPDGPAKLGDGPARPGPTALAALWPMRLDEVRLDPRGLLGSWQARNAAATLPHCIAQLESSGNLANLRRVVEPSGTAYAGMWFADSDVYKTLEAAAWELARTPESPELTKFIDSATALLAGAQDPDGYLNSYFQADNRDRQWRELRSSHELYCAGHLIQAAVAAARAGVGDQLVTVARRFADLLVARFGPDLEAAVCGHPEIETALVELYRVTGHRPYLELAARFVDLRGHGLLGDDKMGRQYYQDHRPVRVASEATGHVVRQLYLLAGTVDVAVETGDVELLAAAVRQWESAFGTKTYLTGAQGSRHRDEAFGDPYELPADRGYGETCAAIASFQWNWRMLLATGGRRYADEMERVLYNAIAGSTALDGEHFFYSNPLQLRSGHDGSNEDAPSRRLPWYSCACCPPNLARLMASLHSYLATTDETGLQLHLYSPGTISTTVDGHRAEVTVRGDYPWHGRIELEVRSDSPGPWTLALRIPAWCQDFRLWVAGQEVEGAASDGYLRLRRDWSHSTVVLELAMPARLVAAHPHVDAVRGCLAVVCGPLVYCLEQADLPPGVALEDVSLDRSVRPERAGHDGPELAGAVVIAASGLVRPAGSGALYREATDAEVEDRGTAIELTAVPYFLWGNRTAGPMRVWIPVTDQGPAA
jgi:DUF1680 family protein